MQATERLRGLCGELADSEPKMKKILPKVMAHGIRFDSSRIDHKHLLGIISESHLYAELERLASFSGNPYRIELGNGIRNNQATAHYRFSRGSRRGELDWHIGYYKSGRRGRKGEYDAVAIVDGVPVVFEVKAWKSLGTVHAYKKEKPARESISYNLRPEAVEERLEPAREFYGKDVGYVMAVRPGIVRMIEQASQDIYMQFVGSGGIVTPICRNFSSIEKQVNNVARFLKTEGYRRHPDV